MIGPVDPEIGRASTLPGRVCGEAGVHHFHRLLARTLDPGPDAGEDGDAWEEDGAP